MQCSFQSEAVCSSVRCSTHDDFGLAKNHLDKTYCLNCYTLLYGKEKETRKRKRYNKELKTQIKAYINTKDYNKISDKNISEIVRKSIEYIVTHPVLMNKIIGD